MSYKMGHSSIRIGLAVWHKRYNILSKIMKNLLILSLAMLTFSCQAQTKKKVNETQKISMEGKELATFGAGCFWCVEAVFQRLEGVEKVESGYAGGTVENPTYKQVCTGSTNHAEVLRIVFDPKKITFDELLEVFWKIHDPTTLNRQGEDVGTQYRSVVFYHNDKQKELAEKYKAALDAEGAFSKPIVTEISPLTNYYPAEDYHQNYFNENGNSNPYCSIVVRPKVEKFEKVFKNKLKKN